MSIASAIRDFARKAAPDRAAQPRVALPSWLLIPGVVLFLVGLIAYVQFIRAYRIYGLDLLMYRGGLRAFLDGAAVYRLGYTDMGLPYTYPPITLVFLLPLLIAGEVTTLYAWTGVGICALMLTLWFTTRTLGYRGVAGRLGLVGAVGALMLWTEPFQWNFSLGQINALVMLPVVIDLSLSDRSRFKGIGIGLATATKLLPGLFIVYLILTRRIRAAVTATATFVVLTAAGWVIQPGGSYDYWIRGLAFDSHRVLMVLGPKYTGNQSLQGLVARVLNTQTQNGPAWIIAVILAAVGGLALAVWAQRRGEEAMGMVIVAFTALLISPVSWSHYWLWIAPMMLVLVDVARRAVGRVQIVAAGIASLAVLPFMMWPLRPYSGGPLLPQGIIWASGWHGGAVARLGAEPYIPTVLGLFVLAALWLRLRSRSDQLPEPALGSASVAAAPAGEMATPPDGEPERKPDDVARIA
jgi:alpha-1,2-mannosyltransferase